MINIEKEDVTKLVKKAILNVIDSAIEEKGFIEWDRKSLEEENNIFRFHITGFPLDDYYGELELKHNLNEKGKKYSQIKVFTPESNLRSFKSISDLNKIIEKVNEKFKDSNINCDIDELKESIYSNLKNLKIYV